jgi:hypothetical protein
MYYYLFAMEVLLLGLRRMNFCLILSMEVIVEKLKSFV